MTGYQLRENQIHVIDRLRGAIRSGQRRVILHAATGFGKTVCAAGIIKQAHDKGSKVLFLANRREIIFQAVSTLEASGLRVGIIMAGESPDFKADVQVSSMQTFVRRMDLVERERNPWFVDADLIIVDEAHGSICPSYQKILTEYPGKVTIGLTATPCRGDGRGLGEYFDGLVSAVSIEELIRQGHLVPMRYFAPSAPDLDGVKTVLGDYEQRELGRRVNRVELIGDILQNWLLRCGDRQTIVFAVNVKHSVAIVEEFVKNGIRAEHVDANTPTDERADILRRLRDGDTQVVSNVGILCEGFDFPAASAIVLARPTKSLGLFLQMAGRGLRPFPGKQDCILMDHGGCIEQHGLVEWEREWTLDGKEKAWQKPSRERTERVVKCRVCHEVFQGSATCPVCGTTVTAFGKKIATRDAELEELDAKEKHTAADKRRYLGMLKYYVAQKGWNPKSVNAKYRARFQVWPHSSIADVAPILPDAAFIARMKYEQIKWAKAQKRAA